MLNLNEKNNLYPEKERTLKSILFLHKKLEIPLKM